MAEVSTPKEKDKEMDDWEIKDSADTLLKAEVIKNNPKLMKKISKLFKEKKRAINSIEDLRKRRFELKEEE